MEIEIQSIVEPLPDQQLIRKNEEYFRVKFPKDYVSFIEKYNGAVPVKNTLSFNNHAYAVERFLCILENYQDDDVNGWYDIGVTETQIGERLTDNEDLIGAEVIPIALLFAGDFVCLDFRNNAEKPEVCIWYHEQSEPFKPVTKKVADSFEEFLNMLTE